MILFVVSSFIFHSFILWKANMLPLRRLGVLGLALILVATSLQAVPAVIDLISIFGTSK